MSPRAPFEDGGPLWFWSEPFWLMSVDVDRWSSALLAVFIRQLGTLDHFILDVSGLGDTGQRNQGDSDA